MNTWKTRKFIKVVSSIQLAILGLISLAIMCFDTPGLRQIVGFVFLTFVPGLLILRILRINNLDIVKTILYSAGLSIAFIMFIGLFINVVFPHIGISKPISILPVTVTLTILTIILAIITYIRDRDFQPPGPSQVEKQKLPLSGILFMILLPILAVLGAFLVTYLQDNTLLLILITVIAFLPALIAFNKLIPEKIFPLAVVSIALVLLLHQTLISPYLAGYDIHLENYYQRLVSINGYWDASISHNLNTALSITILCPIYSLILGVGSVWVFKVIYPFIFSLVPLAIFETCREQIGSKRAFLATFFFMSMLVFFTEMTSLARQQIAELFFVLLVLLMIDRKLNQLNKTVLFVIFAISLPVSHYGLAYIVVAFFGIGWLLLMLTKSKTIMSHWIYLNKKYSPSLEKPGISLILEAASVPSVLTGTLVFLYVVFLLSWYMYTSSGTAFNSIVGIGDSIYSNLSEFFSPMAREKLLGTALGLDFAQISILGKVYRVIQYITQFLIIIGFLNLIIKPGEIKFRLEYIALSIVAFLILFSCILVPLFSSFLNLTRFYHIVLIILSPFCILGGEALWQYLERIFKIVSILLNAKKRRFAFIKNDRFIRKVNLVYPLLTLFVLIPYFLFNTGYIFEIAQNDYIPGNIPHSKALSNYRVDYDDYYWKEATGAKWLASNYHGKLIVYCDEYSRLLLEDWLLDVAKYKKFSSELENVPIESYIFLREWNISHREVFLLEKHKAQQFYERIKIDDSPTLLTLLNRRNLIYDNSGSQVLALK